MIKLREIQRIANKTKVRDRQIEKDYIITWILYGISQNKILFNNLIFKGGTVLKKAYFHDYRFSEDLDFTLFNNELSNRNIQVEFNKSLKLINEESNITLKITGENEHKSSQSFNFYIAYIGPLSGNLGSRDLKVDITRNEILEYNVLDLKINSNYSDLSDYNFKIKCYSLSEIFIEKMTALLGRTIPRDLYDLWYLLEYEQIDIQNHIYEFERKAKNKGHNYIELADKILKKENILKRDWEKSLKNQIQDLPDFAEVMRKIKKHLRKLRIE